MTILDRNSGTFNGSTSAVITRSSGSFGTGTVVVVAIFSNTTWQTLSGFTQRTNSVSSMGLYSYDKAGAGEASFTFTANASGMGVWFCWELSSGSSWVTGSAAQTDPAGASYTSPSITPSAGDRHLLAIVGGNGGAVAKNVTSWSDSFTEWADAQAALTGDGTFAAAADRDVTANGSTAYSTTGTFNSTVSVRGGFTLAYVNNAGDVTAPTVPTGLQTTAVGSTTADLGWTASTDAVGVTGYELMVVGP